MEACFVSFAVLLHHCVLLTHLVTRVYEGHHSGTLLKIKTFYDAEAIIVGHAPGKGRNKGITGALKCKMESGKVCFYVLFLRCSSPVKNSSSEIV